MRDPYWDYIRGVAIIAVIAIHSCQSDGLELDSGDLHFNLVFRQFVNFAVPAFLALAGYFDGLSRARSIRNRLLRLLPPYVVWTLIYVILIKRGDFLNATALFRDFVAGTGIVIGYYVMVVLQMTVVMTLLEKYSVVVQSIVIVALCSIGTAFTYFNEMNVLSTKVGFPYNAIFFFVWYPFYHFGFLVARSQGLYSLLERIPLVPMLGVVAVLICGAIWEAIHLQHVSVEFASTQLKLTSKLASFAIVVVIFGAHGRKMYFDGLLPWLGRNSYFVYLFHLLPLMFLAKLMATSLGPIPQFVATPAKLVLVLAVSVGVTWLARRLIPKSGQKWILG